MGHDFLDDFLYYYFFLYYDFLLYDNLLLHKHLFLYDDLLLDDYFLLYNHLFLDNNRFLHENRHLDYDFLLDQDLFFNNNLFLYLDYDLYRHVYKDILLSDDNHFFFDFHWNLYDHLTIISFIPLALLWFLLDIVFFVDEDWTHTAHHETLMILAIFCLTIEDAAIFIEFQHYILTFLLSHASHFLLNQHFPLHYPNHFLLNIHGHFLLNINWHFHNLFVCLLPDLIHNSYLDLSLRLDLTLLKALTIAEFEVTLLGLRIVIGLFVIGTEFIDGETVLFLKDLIDGEGVLMLVFLFWFLFDVDGHCHLYQDLFLDVDWNLFYDGVGRWLGDYGVLSGDSWL